MRFLLTLILTLCLLTGAALADNSVTVMVVTDLHYLSPSLYEGSELFLTSLARGDGKSTMYSGDFLEALVSEIRHQQPDVVLLTGDLTFNGERQSHQELADALRPLTDEGIIIAAIPGNHDVNTMAAVHYIDDEHYERTADLDSTVFREIWQGLLADYLPGPGFSGVIRASDSVWIVLGDYSVYETGRAPYGLASRAMRDWMQQVTEQAAEQGVTLISASHQAILPHSPSLAIDYSVWYGEYIAPMLQSASCRVNLSGHMHMQHILTDERLTDIATGAWCISPHHYGLLTVDPDGSLHYRANTVCAEHLPESVLENSRDFFRSVTSGKLRPSVEALGLSPEDTEAMLDFAMDVNEYYFAGTMAQHPELAESPARTLWQRQGASISFSGYLLTKVSAPMEETCIWDYETEE